MLKTQKNTAGGAGTLDKRCTEGNNTDYNYRRKGWITRQVTTNQGRADNQTVGKTHKGRKLSNTRHIRIDTFKIKEGTSLTYILWFHTGLEQWPTGFKSCV